MIVSFEDHLRSRARAQPRRIVLPESYDERTLAAAAELQRERLVVPVLLGDGEEVRRRFAAAGGHAAQVEVLDPQTDPRRDSFAAELHGLRRRKGMTAEEAAAQVLDPVVFAAMLVRSGEADGSVAGAVSTTAAVLRAAIWCIGRAPGIGTVSSSFYMSVQDFRGAGPEVLTFTDAGVVPEPSAAQLAEIAAAAAVARRAIVGDEPRLAFLAYSTHGSADGPVPEKMRRALALFRERLPHMTADGELQADAALLAEVAARKAPDSELAGRANVLVFPDLAAANIAYKLVQRLARAGAYGPILQGLARPCNDLSRGATVREIVLVSCITALQSHA